MYSSGRDISLRTLGPAPLVPIRYDLPVARVPVPPPGEQQQEQQEQEPTGCLAGLIDTFSRCFRFGGAAGPAVAGAGAPTTFALPGPTRVAPLMADDHQQRRTETENALAAFVAAPDLAIRQVYREDEYSLTLRGPGEPVPGHSHLRTDGAYFYKVDPYFNGGKIPRFRPDRVLCGRFCDRVLSGLNRMPVSAVLITPPIRTQLWNERLGESAREHPWVISATRAVPGRSIRVIDDPAAARRQARGPQGRPTLGPAHVFELTDVFKGAHYHNVIRTAAHGDVIIDGRDDSDHFVTRDMLPSKSIRELFGISRAELLERMEEAMEDTLVFARRYQGLVEQPGPGMADHPEANTPLLTFMQYRDRCLQKIAALRD